MPTALPWRCNARLSTLCHCDSSAGLTDEQRACIQMLPPARVWCSYQEAEKLLEAALPTAEAISGDGHPRVALVLQTLAGVFARTRRISFAEGLYK